jgi:hypothetical protein
VNATLPFSSFERVDAVSPVSALRSTSVKLRLIRNAFSASPGLAWTRPRSLLAINSPQQATRPVIDKRTRRTL